MLISYLQAIRLASHSPKMTLTECSDCLVPTLAYPTHARTGLHAERRKVGIPFFSGKIILFNVCPPGCTIHSSCFEGLFFCNYVITQSLPRFNTLSLKLIGRGYKCYCVSGYSGSRCEKRNTAKGNSKS